MIAIEITTAVSNGTYGFNAGFALDIDALESQMQAYETNAVASNLNANNINLTSGKDTTIQGSNLDAKQDLNINSDNLNILSSVSTKNEDSSSEHKNLNLFVGVYGASGLSGSISQDSSASSSQSTTHNNATLTANNINIITGQDTKIKGVNIKADNQLNIQSKNLEVASVQDKTKSKTRSQGFSIGAGASGISSVGLNQSKGNTNTKEVLLTSLIGNTVNINTTEHTQLTGSLVAAVDKTTDQNGNTITTDNGKLTLSTTTLSASSLNTTTNNKSTSAGLTLALSNSKAGKKDKNGNTDKTPDSISNVSIDYNQDRTNSKIKVLATLGDGNIQIANTDNSSTKLLNRDITDNEVDIYNIKSHRGLKGELDTRLLTKQGRVKIAEDIKKSGMIASAINQIIQTDRAGLKDFFSEVDKLYKTDEAVKQKIANNPALAKALTNPNLTPAQKQQLATQLVNGVMVELGYKKTVGVKVVADANDINNQCNKRQGHYGEDKKIYLNDENYSTPKNQTIFSNF